MMNKKLIFNDVSFPGYKNIDIKFDESYVVCTAFDLLNELQKDYSTFINMHGEFFPLCAVESLFKFLKAGKGFIQMFGTPLVYMCTYNDNEKSWITGSPHLSYYRQLNIHSVLTIDAKDITSLASDDYTHIAKDLALALNIGETNNFIMIPTKDKYVEAEWGSAGSMDVTIRPLVKGVNIHGDHISSPAVLIENRSGDYAGGKWIIVSADFKENAKINAIIDSLSSFVSKGYRELMVKPSMAMYYDNETPTIKIQAENFIQKSFYNVDITIKKGTETIECLSTSIEGENYSSNKVISLSKNYLPGNYTINTVFSSDDNEFYTINQGFCIHDKGILTNMAPLKCNNDYFEINNTLSPVVGTTYMADEVSRAFLQLPNPHDWLKDMLEMRSQGINWVRTGIWCNWRNFMLDDGHFNEHILRSIDAFLQIAATVGLHVTFTFFTFVPEAFEGSHPYISPRSLKAQERFITNIVSRHKNTTNVDWDLINEPFTTDHPSQKKKDFDTCEIQDFRNYMKEQYSSIEEMKDKLDLSNISSFDDLSLPTPSQINFDITDMGDSKNGLIWHDYVKYTLKMFEKWTIHMRDVIKSINNNFLVTVGQDEALRGQRPTPLLYGELLDYNCQHTWWLLDDLVWDTRFTKYFGKPLLVQETGIMYSEMPNGIPRRTEHDLMLLLQKKYAYAYGTKCAGAIHWIWNTNYFLKSANESNIGAKRCDGSQKPEFSIYKKFSSFFKKPVELNIISNIINDEEIAVIFPFTNDFSNRNFVQDSTTKLTKILTYYFKKKFIGVSEFDLKPLLEVKPKVIFVPSPHHFKTSSMTELINIVSETGSTLVFSGPISLDEYFRQSDRLSPYVELGNIQSLSRFETFELHNKTYTLSFDNGYSTKAFKEITNNNYINEYQIGNGKLLHIGIPIELSNDTIHLSKIFDSILKQHNISEDIIMLKEHLECLFISKINWENGYLFTIINESNINKQVLFEDTITNKKYSFNIKGDESALFITDKSGNFISIYNDQPIDIL